MNKIHDGTRQNNCFSIILNCHDITEILLKVALNTITLTPPPLLRISLLLHFKRQLPVAPK